MNAPPAPRVSVIIATYNWSSALRLAIESVLLQTFEDFEILVVGDACTDDSAEVVASFGDPRVHWHNLESNHRSQWGPNNYGLSVARGEFVAYLGHDDLWYPTHLESCVASARARKADIVCGLLMMYGPPRSKLRGLTGFLVDGAYSPVQFMPPSSILHRRDLVDRIGPWRDPQAIDIPTDNDFLFRAHAAGAVFASTEELTAFKFNAAFRRGAYSARPVAEQADLLSSIKRGDDFRPRELHELLRAANDGHLIEVRGQQPGRGFVNRQVLARIRDYKASPGGLDAETYPEVTSRRLFTIDEQFAPFEWHGEELDPVHGPYRWTGPHVVSTFKIPITVDRPLCGRLNTLLAMAPPIIQEMKLEIEGRPISGVSTTRDEPFTRLSFVLPWEAGERPWVGPRISIDVPYVKRPCDVGRGEDTRWLGVAVSSLEIWPAQPESSNGMS